VATFDKLSAEQRAIVELVLQRGKEYGELSEMLGVPEPRVRELARDALVDLAPVSARRVEEDWRGQLADYVLGQQSGPEATATRGHLRRSEAARTWARSLLDSLEQLYDDGSMPAIPEGERPARSRRPQEPAAGARPSDPDAVRRRRAIALAGGLAAVALLAILLWPVGVLTGGDGDEPESTAAADTAAAEAGGVALFFGQGQQRVLQITATGLEPSTDRFAYQVWLYDSRDRARSLGGQVTDRNGTFQAVTDKLPDGFEDYRYIDISREPIDRKSDHSGQSVLRGRMPELGQVRGNQVTRLGQTVLAAPAG
jgi:hypothetical protein